jgi:hypothetical protein
MSGPREAIWPARITETDAGASFDLRQAGNRAVNADRIGARHRCNGFANTVPTQGIFRPVPILPKWLIFLVIARWD